MSKEYLTVKEVAEKVGVSYQAIYKRLNSTLKEYVEEVEGRKVLRSEVLREFDNKKKSTVKDDVQPTFNPSSTSSSSLEEEYKRINERNEKMIDDLRAQLREKDDQIKKQSDHIIDLSNKIAELFDNNQKLQLNYQLLLTDPEKQKDIIEVDPDSAPEEKTDQQDQESTEPEKKSFFQRLFGI